MRTERAPPHACGSPFAPLPCWPPLSADTSSPYFGAPNPFTSHFNDLAAAVQREARPPAAEAGEAAPPPGPPMRTKSSKSLPGK